MPKKVAAIIFTIFYLISAFKLNAQQSENIFYKAALDTAVAFYKTNINANLRLYNGSEYNFAGHNIKGFPYLETDSFVTASITYDHVIYKNVPLQYDIVKDVIVVKDYYQNYFIQLISSSVDSFSILNKTFVLLGSDKNSNAITQGFYQELFNGTVSLFEKKEKAEVQYINEGAAESDYVQTNSYFLQKQGTFYEVEDEHSLLDILKDKKNILKKFAKENKIDFKKDFENALIKTVVYYSGLK